MPTRRPSAARRPVRRTRNPSNANITPALIARIDELTDTNNHTLATIELSRALRNDNTTKALRAIETLNLFYGHMPSALGAMRNDITNKLLAAAKREVDAETYRRLHGAF